MSNGGRNEMNLAIFATGTTGDKKLKNYYTVVASAFGVAGGY